MENQKTPEPLDIMPLVHQYGKSAARFWPIALVLIVLLSFQGFRRSQTTFTPMYRSTAVISVSSATSDSIFSSSSFYDSEAAKDMAASFPYLLDTEFMQDLVRAQLGGKPIGGTITAEALEETNMLTLSVSGRDPQAVYDTLRAVINAYPQAAVYMVDNPNLRVLEEPVVPDTCYNTPASGSSASSGAIRGGIKGLLLSLILLAIPAVLVRPVQGRRDLKKMVNLPIWACLPLAKAKARRKKTNGFLSASRDFAMAEGIRGLRVKVTKSLEDKNGKVVLLTSTVPGEGKTTIAVNLAQSLAAEGHRVILVDADLRKQSVGMLFGTDASALGLRDCLDDATIPVMSCVRPMETPGLFCISGRSTQKRHYNLDGKALQRVFRALEERFDYIVVDTPPSSVVSDTALLCRYASTIVYVVRQDYANKTQVVNTISELHARKIDISACVLNGATHVGYHSGYGYGKDYGKDYGKKTGYDFRK